MVLPFFVRSAPAHLLRAWPLLTVCMGRPAVIGLPGFRCSSSDIVGLAANGNDLSEAELNRMLAVVRGIGPTDTVEALLAVQMAAVHDARSARCREHFSAAVAYFAGPAAVRSWLASLVARL